MKIKYGDIIGVERLGGIYDHYGVYENDNRVYQYAVRNGIIGRADIHITTLKSFIGNSKNYFVLIFPQKYGRPQKRVITAFASSDYIENEAAYHLYSPEETIQRAKSKLGETKYSLFFNNCEHYAIWCKTGIHESHQIKDLLDLSYKVKF